MDEHDRRYMRQAVRLAARGWGRVSPNPLVGAVVVRDGAVVGAGWHREYGGPHAEVHAIRAAGPLARGATMYVSLEPCAHHGRTPPCTDAILAAGIRRLVYGAADADPKAAGGAAILRARGVAVEGPLATDAVRRQNATFFHAHERATPWVALKLAQSLDGGIAAAPGTRTQLTGPPAQRATHRLRAGFDAIMVGAGTARTDDPLLTVRGRPQPRVPPVRVVLDPAASLAVDCRLVTTAAQAPVRVLHGPDADPARLAALAGAGVALDCVPAAPDGGLDLGVTLRTLREAGLCSILCEGGAKLAHALLQADALERIYLWIAPVVLGPAAVSGIATPLSPGWHLARARRAGDDALLEYDRVREAR